MRFLLRFTLKMINMHDHSFQFHSFFKLFSNFNNLLTTIVKDLWVRIENSRNASEIDDTRDRFNENERTDAERAEITSEVARIAESFAVPVPQGIVSRARVSATKSGRQKEREKERYFYESG